jgi:hypothetical protein
MNEINKIASSIFVAPLMFGIGATIENTGRPGALAVAHMLYGWAIIWAIAWHGLVVAHPDAADRVGRGRWHPGGRRSPKHRHHHLEHRMLNAVRIAAIRHCFGEPQANTMFALRLPQKQHATIGRLAAAGKSTVSYCHAGLIREATGGNTSLLSAVSIPRPPLPG